MMNKKAPLFVVSLKQWKAWPKGLPQSNLPLGVGTLIPFSYSEPPPHPLSSALCSLRAGGGPDYSEAWEYPRACTPALHNSGLPHYLACHHYFTC